MMYLLSSHQRFLRTLSCLLITTLVLPLNANAEDEFADFPSGETPAIIANNGPRMRDTEGIVQAEQREFVPGQALVTIRRQSAMSIQSTNGNTEMSASENKRYMLTANAIASTLSTHANVSSLDPTRGVVLFNFSNKTNTLTQIEELRQHPQVENVEPNYVYEPQALDINDTESSQLWGLSTIEAPLLWNIEQYSTTTPPVTVAVIDTGVALRHPDLSSNIWDGSNCKSDTNEELNNCNGGYDFINNDKNPSPNETISGVNEGAHGTHVAGIIAAVRNNNRGVAGVASNVRIMALKSSLTSSEIIRAINFAKYNGAKIINASFGAKNSFSALTRDAIAGFPGLFIAAAGNESTDNELQPFYPCSYTLANIICVAASNQEDSLAPFSNWGASHVHLAAPGDNIRSTVTGITRQITTDLESTSTVTTPGIPTSWSTSTLTEHPASNWHTATTTILDNNNQPQTYTHLYADDTFPYGANRTSAITLPRRNLTSASMHAANLSFGIRCDTQDENSSTTNNDDFLRVQWSSDGTNFVDAKSTYLALGLTTAPGDSYRYITSTSTSLDFNEELLRQLGGNYLAHTDRPGGGYAASIYAAIPDEIRTTSTTIRFLWITGSTEANQNHMGCRLSGVDVTGIHDASNLYSSRSGTSMAAPLVTGVVATAMSMAPLATNMQIKDAVLTTVSSINAFSGKVSTGGRLSANGVAKRLSSRAKKIQGLSFLEASSTVTIEEASSTINVAFPTGSNLSSLTPMFSLSGDATTSFTGAQDFNSPRVAQILSPFDNTTRDYTITARTQDVVPPSIEHIFPTSNIIASGTIPLSFSAVDTDSGVALLKLFIGNTLVATTSGVSLGYEWTTSAGIDGTSTISYVAIDTAGNVSTTTRNITVDNSAPTLLMDMPSNGAHVRGVVHLALQASDIFSTIATVAIVAKNSSTTISSSTSTTTPTTALSWNTVNSPDGAAQLEFTASDNLGNNTKATQHVIVDNTPPLITLNGESVITITKGDTWTDPGATGSDALGSVTMSISGNRDANTTGSRTITYTATDLSGNSTSVQRTFVVNTPASSSGNNSGSGGGNNTSAEVRGCTDSRATNYNSSANTNNGTCTYPEIPKVAEQSSSLAVILHALLSKISPFNTMPATERELALSAIIKAAESAQKQPLGEVRGVSTSPNYTTSEACPTVTLTQGSKKLAEVTKLQKFLISHGFLANENATGIFGPKTTAAVKSWQKSVGIASVGNIGPISLAKIRSSCK